MLRVMLCGLVALLMGWGGDSVRAVVTDDTVIFRAQGIHDVNSSSVAAVAQRAVLREFLREHPEVEVERFAMPNVQGSGMDSGPLMAIAAGIPPHAIYVNFRQSSTYVAEGFLEPMEILLARLHGADARVREVDDEGQWLAEPSVQEIATALASIRARVPDQAWEVVYRADDRPGYGDEKHVWALPTSTLVMAMLYRKDLFYEAGLDPEHPPENWDQMMTMAQRLTVPALQQSGLMIPGGQGISWGTYSFLVSNGARAVAVDENGTWHAAYGNRAAAEAIEYVWRLVKEPFERDGEMVSGAAKVVTSEGETMWQRGQIAMRFSYLEEELLGDINPQLVGIAPVPAAPSGARGSELNCRMMGVFRGSTPAQQLAVMEYIWFITGERAQRIRTQVYVDGGFGLFVSPDLLKKFGYDRLLARVPDGWKKTFDTALAHGVPEPYGRNTQHIYRYMSDPIHAALELDLSNATHEQAINQILGLLETSVEKANTKLLGNVPADVMARRRVVTGIVVVLIAVVFAVGALMLWRFFTVAAPVSTEGGRSRHWVAWAMLFPALGFTLAWLYVPLSGGLVLAFTDYRLVSKTTFVGLDNFAEVLYDGAFWMGLGRTFYFVTLMIGLGFWPPILLAILLDEVPTAVLKYLFRTLFYLPAIISGVIIMFLWKQLYDPSEYGVLNQLLLSANHLHPVVATVIKWVIAGLWLSLIGVLVWLPIKMDEMSRVMKGVLWFSATAFIGVTLWMIGSGSIGVTDAVGRFEMEPLRWVKSPVLAMFCVVLPTVWAGSGPGCLLYLAALKTIPTDLYEAADIDGAGLWHKVCYIMLPRLKFLIGIQFIAALVGAFKGGTDFILALTGGGPNGATMILALEIFVRTFMDLRFGVGTAMAWLLGVLLVGFTAYQMKMLTRAEFTAAGSSEGDN